MSGSLAEALRARRFCYVVELVASGLTRESRVFDVAARLARVPELAAVSVTSYAGGAIGHDPIRVATAARSRGVTPNVHLTCVSQDRHGLCRTLEDLHALGLHNVFALTGDWPRAADAPPPVFDLDSVQLVALIAELRRAGMPFHVAVAVSPFKYTEADARWQYAKLAKKLAAGADCAITQVGWDARKLAELGRWLRERRLDVPVLGNVYVLGPRAAEKMAGGQPPGCWVSPALLAEVRREREAPDGGLRARLERAARMVAVLRGLGYAGAYLGGTHDAEHVSWIIRRAGELAGDWERHAAELAYGAPDGFYLYPDVPWTRQRLAGGPSAGEGLEFPREAVAGATGAGGPPNFREVPAGRPTSHVSPDTVHNTEIPRAPGPRSPGVAVTAGSPRWLPKLLDALGRLFPVRRDTRLRRALRRLFAWVDRHPALAATVERAELAVKKPLFGCQACGNCVLGDLEYVCPQTCPKQLRNGPCGGTHFGRCEVVDQPCVWVAVWERAHAAGREDGLRVFVPAPDRSLANTSSWINYFLERDARPR